MLLAFGSIISHADNDSSLDQETIDRLRETYQLEAEAPPFTLSSIVKKLSDGDWGSTLDSTILPSVIHIGYQPVLYFIRQMIYVWTV
ncbi:hypothetical protein [Paenibacillus sp. JCM 10914]